MIERVEMIARLTTEGACHERDREIALSLIADIAGRNLSDGYSYSVILSLDPMQVER
ncbi:TPA: Tum protein [Escherichia coli]|nr:Tum protein [Escherichia coli]HCI3258936.1 Tum protein [Escherichia coli]HCI4992066.1 Tum protein [Escherichia coli]HCI7860555.1 Tum protein [Escherichia coli]HCI8516595.1 Tum protein [Escherichia coli]